VGDIDNKEKEKIIFTIFFQKNVDTLVLDQVNQSQYALELIHQSFREMSKIQDSLNIIDREIKISESLIKNFPHIRQVTFKAVLGHNKGPDFVLKY